MQPSKKGRWLFEDKSKFKNSREITKSDNKKLAKYDKANKDDSKAYYKKVKNKIACEISIISADGIAYPDPTSSFDPSKIVKRAIRVGLYKSDKKKFIANTA